jgi:hypothetical protein
VPLEMGPGEKRRSLWPFLVGGAIIVVVVLVIFGFFSGPSGSNAPSAKALPFGPADQSYAADVKFENLRMSRFANILHQQVTYVMGDIYNAGNRTIGDLQINMEFRDVEGKVVYQETLRPLEPNPVPIRPGERRSFQLAFDQIPSDWNEANPTIRVTGLVLQ